MLFHKKKKEEEKKLIVDNSYRILTFIQCSTCFGSILCFVPTITKCCKWRIFVVFFKHSKRTIHFRSKNLVTLLWLNVMLPSSSSRCDLLLDVYLYLYSFPYFMLVKWNPIWNTSSNDECFNCVRARADISNSIRWKCARHSSRWCIYYLVASVFNAISHFIVLLRHFSWFRFTWECFMRETLCFYRVYCIHTRYSRKFCWLFFSSSSFFVVVAAFWICYIDGSFRG